MEDVHLLLILALSPSYQSSECTSVSSSSTPPSSTPKVLEQLPEYLIQLMVLVVVCWVWTTRADQEVQEAAKSHKVSKDTGGSFTAQEVEEHLGSFCIAVVP